MHLSHVDRGSRGLVRELRLRRARHDRVPAGARRAGGHPGRPDGARAGLGHARRCAGSTARAARIGHSASIQTTSRLQADVDRPRRDRTTRRAPRSRSAPTSTRSTTRSSTPTSRSVIQAGPMAGIHFLVFNPSSDDFDRNRLAMDGVLPGGDLDIPPRDRAQGFNSILTHDAPPELPRAAAAAPQLPARRALSRERRESALLRALILARSFSAARAPAHAAGHPARRCGSSSAAT